MLSAKIAGMKSKIMQLQKVRDNQFDPQVHQVQPPNLPMNDALQIKAAEYLLKLGEADLALKELENLPSKIWHEPAALRVRIAAIGALRERSEVAL